MTLATAIVLVMLLVYVLVTGQQITARYAPLLQNINQIRQHTTAAWLDLSEMQSHPGTDRWQHLWQSLHQASALGAKLTATLANQEGERPSRLHDEIVIRITELQTLMSQLIDQSIRHYGGTTTVATQFGHSYQQLLSSAQGLDTLLRSSLDIEMSHFRRHSLMLLGFVLLLATGLILLLQAILANNRQQMMELRRATREIRKKNILLEQLAYFDHLTGLPNSPLFRDRTRQALLHAQREGYSLVLLYLDLDGFKGINDSMGHEAGDHLLVETAKRISRSVRKEDTVSRLSGDEFAILLANMPDLETAEETSRVIAEKILGRLQQPIEIDGEAVTVSASIGIALYPVDGDNADQLLRAADTAMYLAKSAGKSNYQYFSRRALGTHIVCEQELRASFDNNTLELHYQPQWHLASNELSGLEVLVRCRDERHGIVYPSGLLPVAERNALIGKLDLWVTERACRDFARWRGNENPPPKIALNLSPATLGQSRFASRFLSILKEHRIPASRIEIELSDEALLSLSAATLAQLQPLFDRGVHLAVSCSGTRYRALELLARLPVSALKTEQRLCRSARNNELIATMLTNVADIAGKLGAVVIAEGIESAADLEEAVAHGCDIGQGYFLGAPQPAEEIEHLLHTPPDHNQQASANIHPFPSPPARH